MYTIKNNQSEENMEFDSSLFPINVTRSFMPPLSEVVSILEGIWGRTYLTNNGPVLLDFEKKIAEKNGVEQAITVLNGTIAIELALDSLNIHDGEVITTPFTFPATSTAILRRGAHPVFVDIDPKTWNIDPLQVEKAITPKTKAILAVHVFSCPCDVLHLEHIAQEHGLKLIYDAAHANFVKWQGQSIFNWGDCSTTSFHATKIFHTIEGGACFSKQEEVRKNLKKYRFFGYEQPSLELTDAGTNAKMTEVSAAVGLANLKYIDDIIKRRRYLYEFYLNELQGYHDLTFQVYNSEEYNYSYFPVLFKDEEQLLKVYNELKNHKIFARRYFYPLVSDMQAFSQAKKVGNLSIATNISSRVLCLPLYPDLHKNIVKYITSILVKNL